MAQAPPDPCTEPIVKALLPCLDCLSVSQLEAIEILAWNAANGNGLQVNLPEFHSESACFQCMSKKELMESRIAVMLTTFLPAYTVQQLLHTASCLVCDTPRARAAILNRFQCKYWANNPPRILL